MLTDIAAKVITSHGAIKKAKLASQIAKELAASGRELAHMRKALETAITKNTTEDNMKKTFIKSAETVKEAKKFLALAKPHEKNL